MSLSKLNRYELEQIVHTVYTETINRMQLRYPKMTIPTLDCISSGIGRAGRYYSRQHKIEINVAYCFAGIESLTETIVHELCHHLQYQFYYPFKQWHGPEFRYIMQQFGYSGNTYHSNSVSVAKQVASKHKEDLFTL